MSNEARWRRNNGRWVGPLLDPVADQPTKATQIIGAPGAADPAPQRPQLLGPDGSPIEPEPLPFGFQATC